MAKALKYSLIILSVPAILLAMVILYATLSDYRPDEHEVISAGKVRPVLNDSSVLTFLIWNIGYAGLDKDMDFFYDGGSKVRSPESNVSHNLSAIRSFLKSNDSVDFILLQEIDIKSRRSYKNNQVMQVAEDLPEHRLFFGKNYDVFFVPVPFTNPMGSVNSGVASFTQFTPALAERYSFPGNYAWPKRLFMLDRCFLVLHFPVANGRELIVINTHNEAYDDGTIRDEQMKYLRDYLLAEFNKGNYVIVGGDWNQCPPEFNPGFQEHVFDTINNKGIPTDYLPENWQWVYDPSLPTNRRVDITYTKGKTATTLIDFYLVSPNITPLYIQTTDLNFENSDHQPVLLKLSLNKAI